MVVAQAVAPKAKETTQISEKESLQLTRNLLRIAVFNISYIRGLFPDKYFDDKYVPALEMKIKKLLPADKESRRLIEWMEQGVYDALQRKYLKTMIFAICEADGSSLLEEYSFNFSYQSSETVTMEISKTGSKTSRTLNACGNDVTPAQMKSAACKMVRTLVQLMRTLDKIPNERTIVVKLLYRDDVTPEEYEPPFFRSCNENEQLTWAVTPLKMKVGDVDSKHYSIALKVRSILDPCDNDDQQESQSEAASESEDEENNISDPPDAMDCDKQEKSQTKEELQNGSIPSCKEKAIPQASEDTEDADYESLIHRKIKEWVLSRPCKSIDTMDVLASFSDISLVLIEDLLEKLANEGILEKTGRDLFVVCRAGGEVKSSPPVSSPPEGKVRGPQEKGSMKEAINHVDHSTVAQNKESDEDELYNKVLQFAWPLQHLSLTSLQKFMGARTNSDILKKLVDRMVHDGFLEPVASNRRKGRKVLHSSNTEKKLKEISDNLKACDINKNVEPREDAHTIPVPEGSKIVGQGGIVELSTVGRVQSVGSESTCQAEALRMSSLENEFKKPPIPTKVALDEKSLKRKAAPGISSSTNLPHVSTNNDAIEAKFYKDSQENPGSSQHARKASMVIEPIHQLCKKLRVEP